jgi:hypothetical protein
MCLCQRLFGLPGLTAPYITGYYYEAQNRHSVDISRCICIILESPGDGKNSRNAESL